MADSTATQLAQIQADLVWIKTSIAAMTVKLDRRCEECEDRLKTCEARFGALELKQGISTTRLTMLVAAASLVVSAGVTVLVGVVKQLLIAE